MCKIKISSQYFQSEKQNIFLFDHMAGKILILPNQGSNSCILQWKHEVVTIGLPWKSPQSKNFITTNSGLILISK